MGMSFGKLVVKLQRLFVGSLRFRPDLLRRRMSKHAQRSIGGPQHNVRECEIVIKGNRLLKVWDGIFDVRNATRMHKVAASDIKLPGFLVLGVMLPQSLLL